MYFKQFGLQRSGTNIAKNLLELNFSCRVFSNFPIRSMVRRLLLSVKSNEASRLPLREFVWVGKLDSHKNWRLALCMHACCKSCLLIFALP